FANAIEIDGSQCIDCRNCIDSCSLTQKINYLKLTGKGSEQEITPVDNEQPLFNQQKISKKVDCIYCGQCAAHCPVGAAQEQSHWEMVEKALKNKNKIVIAQFDPLSLISIGEEFNLPYNKISIGQIATGLRQLGFNYIFDINFGANITAIIEAEELVSRIKNKKNMPLLASHCPAWVKYIEFYYPEFIPNLTFARSPHINNGGVIKTYWAEQLKIDPKNIIVVSITPCTAKKFETSRKELKIKGNWPVDYVLTVRELAWLFKKNRVEFDKLKNSLADNLFKDYNGIDVVCGANGGVMEPVLRVAQDLFRSIKKTAGSCQVCLDFKKINGLSAVKETKIKIAGKNSRVAIVNGIGDIKSVLDKISNYDYIEIMACPEGCSGGGGQPLPTNNAIIQKRIKAFYKLNKNKKNCLANKIPETKQFLNWLKLKPTLEHKILHTFYKKRKFGKQY
ncbi:MAG: [Fe-Fe] hydrogenase large subunit C-terminal domain-containing protein, partial [Patescibacteria group bacterium]